LIALTDASFRLTGSINDPESIKEIFNNNLEEAIGSLVKVFGRQSIVWQKTFENCCEVCFNNFSYLRLFISKRKASTCDFSSRLPLLFQSIQVQNVENNIKSLEFTVNLCRSPRNGLFTFTENCPAFPSTRKIQIRSFYPKMVGIVGFCSRQTYMYICMIQLFLSAS
jgi:hypothetical protein